MAWFKCLGTGGGGSSSGVEETIIEAQKISDTAGGGTYLYPTYPDLTQTNYEAIIVKIYMTKSDVYYERYISFALKDIPYRQSNIDVYDAQGNAYSFSLTIQFNATAVTYITYTGSWETIYIDMYGVKQGSGGGDVNAPTKFWQGLQSQYDALISHESDRMYTIVASISQMSDTMGGYINKISKIYIGDTLVYPVEEQGYDWCITDYFLPDSNASTNGDNRDYDMNVGVYFQSDANKNRDWQIEFKATLSTGSYSSGDQVLFGQGNNSSARLKEVYFNTSGNLYISGNSISDTDYISDANGHDIKMIYSNTNGTIELYKDGTLVNTITGVPTSYSAANYELGLCRYKSSYRFHGTINYFKFKWLS